MYSWNILSCYSFKFISLNIMKEWNPQWSAVLINDFRGQSSQVGGLALTHLPHWLGPLPALANAGKGAVHARKEEQQFEHQDHRRHNQTQHVARWSVPFVGRGTKKFVPAINVTVRRTNEQGQVAQLRLRGKKYTTFKEDSERIVALAFFAFLPADG